MADTKAAVRERVWALLQREGAARFPGAGGKIPNYRGAERAADALAELPEWDASRVLKSNPDAPQLPVRARALAEGKVVYMAVPRLREPRPFLRLDPSKLTVPPRVAASIRGASEHAVPTSLGQVSRVDLVVCGSVAVDRRGARVGKGGGYSDLEFALLVERGRIDDHTLIATTVHPLQVLDEDLRRPSTTSASTSSSRPTRSSGAVARRGPRGSCGTTWTSGAPKRSRC